MNRCNRRDRFSSRAVAPKALVLLAFTALGCREEPIDPVKAAPAAPPTNDRPTWVPPTATAPVAPKRTVIERSPYGNVKAAQNLLWDGDFEWSSPFADQYGWIEPPSNPTVSDVVVGPDCRSGVKCVRLKRNADVVGIGVSSATQGLVARIWARFQPEEGEELPTCASVDAFVFDAGGLTPSDPEVALAPKTEQPDAEGWCELVATSPVRANKSYLFVANRSKVAMLLDDATLLPADGPIPSPSPAVSSSSHAAERPAALARARAAIRATRRFGDGPPNPAREALARHKRPGEEASR
jgi:hypothetical protein